MRERRNEILFIDGRKLGSMIPGSRKQKALSEEEQMDKNLELSDYYQKES